MDYETLDKIADSYVPALAILALLAAVFLPSGSQSRVKTVFFRFIFLIILLGVAYGFMFLDNAYLLWPKMGLDYSTHTAVSSVLVLFLSLLAPKLLLLWSLSLVTYYGLMLYQGYHSLADILSTVFVVAITVALIFIPVLIERKGHKIGKLFHANQY